jgi:hypothetical protein
VHVAVSWLDMEVWSRIVGGFDLSGFLEGLSGTVPRRGVSVRRGVTSVLSGEGKVIVRKRFRRQSQPCSGIPSSPSRLRARTVTLNSYFHSVPLQGPTLAAVINAGLQYSFSPAWQSTHTKLSAIKSSTTACALGLSQLRLICNILTVTYPNT